MTAADTTRAPLDRIMPSFVPVILERGVPGYMGDNDLTAGERRLALSEVRPLLVASAYIGADAAAAEQGFDRDRVLPILTKSVRELDSLVDSEISKSLYLTNRFYSYKIIRAEHNFDDWICEAFWGEYQSAQYVYPSALAGAVSYGLTIMQSLRKCSIESPLAAPERTTNPYNTHAPDLQALVVAAQSEVKDKWVYFCKTIHFKDTVQLADRIEMFSAPVKEFLSKNYPQLLTGPGLVFWMLIFNAVIDARTHPVSEVNSAVATLREKYANG